MTALVFVKVNMAAHIVRDMSLRIRIDESLSVSYDEVEEAVLQHVRVDEVSCMHCQSAASSLPGHTEESNSERDTPDTRSRRQSKTFCLRMRTKTEDSVHSSHIIDAI